MTHHVFTRQALYDRVWAEPMRTVALSLGVSGVGLAKACRAAAIPVPPRGYWAKLQHNKPLPARPALPERPGAPDRVVIAPSAPRPTPSPAVQAVAEAAVDASVVDLPADLRRPHRIVQGWITVRTASRHAYATHPPQPLPQTNAPLLISPGSHHLGKIPEADVPEVVSTCGVAMCLAEAGDIWSYATPILHASDRAGRRPAAAFFRWTTRSVIFLEDCNGLVSASRQYRTLAPRQKADVPASRRLAPW